MAARLLLWGSVAALAAADFGLVSPAAVGAQTADTLTSEDGARLETKLVTILRQADAEAPEPRLTTLSESEINAYLKFQGATQLPGGLTEPKLQIGADEAVSAEAVVDLNLIRQQRARGWLDPLQYLAGRLRVTASGRVRSGDGMAQIEIESVTIADIPVPPQVLQELVRYYTRTDEHPDGTQLDQPIPLPYRIAELRLSPGQAVIVQ